MSIKTILVPVDGTEAARPALETAFAVAKEFSAHVDVLHVSADPKDAVPLLGEGMSGAMIEEMIEYAEKESGERAASARRMFDDQCARVVLRLVELREDRQAERRRFAGAGLGAADQVATLEKQRDAPELNRRRIFVTHRANPLENVVGKPQ